MMMLTISIVLMGWIGGVRVGGIRVIVVVVVVVVGVGVDGGSLMMGHF
jgi:hypothetical protein